MKSRGKNTFVGTPALQLAAVRGAWPQHWLQLLAALSIATGCELGNNVQGLAEELANPDPQNVESPGHLVASGKYRGLSFDGNATDGPYVVSVEDGKSLSILHFPEGEGCSAGPVESFGTSLTQSDAAFDARIPMVAPAATEQDLATLRFVDFNCKADKLTIAGGALPLDGTFAEKPGFIVQTVAGEVLFVDPWRGKKKLIASGATAIRRKDLALFAEGVGGARWMWTIESGELVARNTKFEEVFRAGKNIASVQHTPNETVGPILALLDTSNALHTVLASDPKSLTQITSDACFPQFNAGTHGLELLYFSPCAEHSLHISELQTGTVRDVRSNILDYKIVGATDTGPVLLYLIAADPEGKSTTFWARWGQNEPIRLGENGHLGLSRITTAGEARVVVDWDGTAGTLLVGTLGEPLKTKAKAVAYHSSAGVITNFDGENGILQRFTETDSLEMIVEQVSARGIRNDNTRDRALFLREFNGADGRLVLIEGNEIRSMSARVRPNSYQFTVQENRVTLLSDLDPETNTATLKLPSTEYDDEGIINTGVSESLEVDWPSSGLLYSAPAAKKPGIYFARFY